MLFASIERGELENSDANRKTIAKQNGKLRFRAAITRAQSDSSGLSQVHMRADDIRRKANRALREDPYWIQRMAAAFCAAFYAPFEREARFVAFENCAQISEIPFFGRSLVPFIEGRFDPSKAVAFTLPDFMPNITKRV
jgi:hypothetical protein